MIKINSSARTSPPSYLAELREVHLRRLVVGVVVDYQREHLRLRAARRLVVVVRAPPAAAAVEPAIGRL